MRDVGNSSGDGSIVSFSFFVGILLLSSSLFLIKTVLSICQCVGYNKSGNTEISECRKYTDPTVVQL
jgi:hypothetical protein